DVGEVVAQVAGSDLRIDVALLDLERGAVLEMSEERVVERRAGLDPAALGELARGAHRLERVHAHAMLPAARAALGGEVAPLEGVGVHALLGDEGADSGHPDQHPVRGQLAERPVRDRKSTRLNSSHRTISYAVFCLKK